MKTPIPGETFIERILDLLKPYLPYVIITLIAYQYFVAMPKTSVEINAAQQETSEALLKLKRAESLLKQQAELIDALQSQVEILAFVTKSSLVRIDQIDRAFHAQADTAHANILKRSEAIKKQLR